MGKVAAHMHWCEDWEFCTEYEKGDVVRRGGLLWLCLAQNAGHDPRYEFNRNYWFPFSEDSGGGTMDHESLLNRLGVGDDGETYHLSELQYKVLVQVAVIPEDGNVYGIKYDLATKKYVWVPVEDGGSAAWKYYRGPFPNEAALNAAHPTDIIGAYAVNLETRTFWIWGGLAVKWVDTGVDSTDIQGLPPGGFAGQVLTKKSDADGDVEWADPTGGGAGGNHNDLNGLQGGSALERFHLSEAAAYATEYAVPDKPYNISPEDDAIDVTERPWFVSSDYHHMRGYEMYGYNLQLLNSAGDVVFDSGLIEQFSTTWMPDAGVLENNTTYQWRVRYCGTNFVNGEPAWSMWSAATTFSTETEWSDPSILPPQILSPADGSVLTTSTPLATTTPFDAGSGLTQSDGPFQVARDAGFTNIVDAGVGKTSYLVGTDLTRGAQHFIRCRHAGLDGDNVEHLSPWSPRVGVLIRKFFREQRLGIVLTDPVTWATQRVGADFEPVEFDGSYWANNGIYSHLDATANLLVNGNPLSALPKFWIRSGVVPSGRYTGKRMWVVDIETPSEEDQVVNDWHIHNMFLSEKYGTQDQVYLSRWLSGITSNLPTILEVNGGTPGAINYANIATTNAAANLNTDESNPLTRGYHVMTYMEYEALKLLAVIEAGSFETANSRFFAAGALFHGIQIAPYTSQGRQAARFGHMRAQSLVPGQTDVSDATTPVTDNTSTRAVNRLMDTGDGTPRLRLGDYLLTMHDAGSVNNQAPGSANVSGGNSSAAVGPISTPSAGQSILQTNISSSMYIMMAKWT